MRMSWEARQEGAGRSRGERRWLSEFRALPGRIRSSYCSAVPTSACFLWGLLSLGDHKKEESGSANLTGNGWGFLGFFT